MALEEQPDFSSRALNTSKVCCGRARWSCQCLDYCALAHLLIGQQRQRNRLYVARFAPPASLAADSDGHIFTKKLWQVF
eukprot:11870-Heterococcus_DN1.PRE.2